jgi:hypothetical protein
MTFHVLRARLSLEPHRSVQLHRAAVVFRVQASRRLVHPSASERLQVTANQQLDDVRDTEKGGRGESGGQRSQLSRASCMWRMASSSKRLVFRSSLAPCFRASGGMGPSNLNGKIFANCSISRAPCA